MKVLVYPHDLGMGGSQLNAIELAAAVRDLGHEVAVYGRPGTLVERIEALGLSFLPSPPPIRRPDRHVIGDLRARLADGRFDIVHGYEWPPILEGRLACLGTRSVATGTVMSMAVPPFIPRDLPLVVGTRQIAAHETELGRTALDVIEPPVDLTFNKGSDRLDVSVFQKAHSIPEGFHVVVVSRLADELKLEGLLTAIEYAPRIGPDVVLTVVGDGPARARVEEAAAEANRLAARTAVVLTGEVSDPRPAYAMADIALGMGGSALRAMAFGAPLVVQGEKGFWLALTPETLTRFQWTGWYGVGAGVASGGDRFIDAVGPLYHHPNRRAQLGQFALDTVEQHFSLAQAAKRQEQIYLTALESSGRRGISRADVSGGGRFVAYKASRWRRRLMPGPRSVDDFNAHPVAAGALPPPRDVATDTPLVIYAAGVAWDGVEGTDHRLVEELSRRMPVLWVDPPRPLTRKLRPHPGVIEPKAGLHQLTPSLWRLHVLTTPGVSRPILRSIAQRQLMRAVDREAGSLGYGNRVGVVAHPEVSVAALPVVSCALLMTDDFSAGAELLGTDPTRTRELIAANVRSADAVLAVSPTLVERLGGPSPKIRLFPNGCVVPGPVAEVARLSPDEPPVAVVVGQLNERLDMSLLLRLADRGVRLLLVGPRYEQDPAAASDLDDLISREGVTWVGRQPYSAIPSFLASATVGLTPYRDTEFNRASFPLKTLEYLAFGLPVVSTDLPASRWLGTPTVDVASSPEEFVDLVVNRLADGSSSELSAACQAVARSHSWASRAADLVEILSTISTEETPLPPVQVLRSPQ